MGFCFVSALIGGRAAAQETQAPRSWSTRLAQVQDATQLASLVGEMAKDAAHHARDDGDFAANYVEASLRWLEALESTAVPLEARRAAFGAALEACEGFGSAADCTTLADVWAGQLGDGELFVEAEGVLTRVLDRGQVDEFGMPYVLEHLASIAREAGHYEQAQARIAQARQAAAKIEATALECSAARCEIELTQAQIELDMGLAELARATLQRAESEPATRATPRLAVRVRIALCNWTFAADDAEQACELMSDAFLEQALAEDSALHAQAMMLRGAAETEVARARRASGSTAELHLREALELPAITRALASAARLCLCELALARGDSAEARAQLEQCQKPARGSYGLATRIAALHVAVALAEHAPHESLDARTRELGDELARFMQNVSTLPLRKGGYGFLRWGSRRMAFSEWIRAQLELDATAHGCERALEPLIAAQGLGTLARSLSATASLEDVRRALVQQGRGVLVFLPSLDRSHVIAIDADGVAHELLAGQHVLWSAASTLESVWAAAPNSSPAGAVQRRAMLESAGRAATRAYLPPPILERIQKWSSVVIVGADLCTNPAFECFVLDDGSFLGLRKGLVYSSSLPVSVVLAERALPPRAGATAEIVFVGAPVLGDARSTDRSLPADIALDASDRERLLAPFTEGQSRAHTGRDATVAALETASAEGARVLAVLAHGKYDAQGCGDGERPALLLLAPTQTSTGFACCTDFERMRMPPLVELLACGAARGPLRLGDGTAAQLVGAAILAGANTVLASRADVGLRSTITLAAAFHERLRTHGDDPALALLLARQAVASEPDTSDPWYWAGPVLHGDASRPLFEPSQSRSSTKSPERTAWRWIIGALATVVVIASAGYAVRRRPRDRS